MERHSIAVDGGFLSRKLVFAFLTSVLILIASKLCPGVGLGEVVSGLVAVCAIYLTGNTVVKWKAGSIEQAKAAIPGTLGKAVEKAVEIADKQSKEETPTVKPEDDERG